MRKREVLKLSKNERTLRLDTEGVNTPLEVHGRKDQLGAS